MRRVRQRFGSLQRRDGLVMLLASGVVITIVYILHGILRPPSPVHLPLQSVHFPLQDSGNLFIPQGWQMFTQDPRLPHITALKWSTGQWVYISYANSSPRNLFGIRRTSIRDTIEIRRLMNRIPEDAWQRCGRDPTTCLNDLADPLPVKNPTDLAHVCGDIGLVRQQTMRASERAQVSLAFSSAVVRLAVTC
jgi:antimicrobial peptide system SdpA family protein